MQLFLWFSNTVIKVDVNPKAVMLGCKGSSGSNSILELAKEAVEQDLLGIMVWYASVPNGLQYAVSWDASLVEDSQQGYIDALQYLQNHWKYLFNKNRQIASFIS